MLDLFGFNRFFEGRDLLSISISLNFLKLYKYIFWERWVLVIFSVIDKIIMRSSLRKDFNFGLLYVRGVSLIW